MRKKVLITGGAGFLGYHLADFLSRSGCEVTVADNFSRGVRDHAFRTLVDRPHVDVFECDLRDSAALRDRPRDYDSIYHLAAVIGVNHVVQQPYEVLRSNVTALLNVLEFARALKQLKRFIFASSSEVYAGTFQHFGISFPTSELTPLTITDMSSPRSTYLLSKLYGEALCHHAGIPFTILRPHNIYGPRMGMAHVIPELLQKAYVAKDGDDLQVFSPDHKRAFCYVDDAVNMMVAVEESPQTERQTLNVGDMRAEVTIRELANIVIELTKKNLRIKAREDTPGSPPRRCPDMTRMAELTECRSRVDLRDGIAKTFRWYERHVFSGHEMSAT